MKCPSCDSTLENIWSKYYETPMDKRATIFYCKHCNQIYEQTTVYNSKGLVIADGMEPANDPPSCCGGVPLNKDGRCPICGDKL